MTTKSEKSKKVKIIKWFKIGDYEFETKLHTEMDCCAKIKIPEGCELITFLDFLEIVNNHTDKFDFGAGDFVFDEIVKQPFKINEEKYPYWNVWLRGLSDDSGLAGGSRNLRDGGRVRGVRFKRKIKHGN